MTCTTCQSPFTPKRSDAKFCDPKCKAKYNRTDNSVTDKRTDNVTDSVTANMAVTVKCPPASHHPNCLQCKGDTCSLTYVDCSRWGQVCSTYHQAMCPTL